MSILSLSLDTFEILFFPNLDLCNFISSEVEGGSFANAIVGEIFFGSDAFLGAAREAYFSSLYLSKSTLACKMSR